MRTALLILAILATTVSAEAGPGHPQNPPERLYMEAWHRAEALPPSEALCRTRLPRRLMRALHDRCLWLTAGTSSNCGVEASCSSTLGELRAWCPAGEMGAVPCSAAAYLGARF